MMRKWTILLLSFCFMLLGAMTVSAQDDSAYVRVGHFASDVEAVDVYLNGELSDVQGLTYGDVTPWMQIPAGTYSVAITLEGGSVDSAIASVNEVELEAGTWATISAVGSLGEDSLTLQPSIEDYKTPVADGTTRVSLFNGIEGMSGIALVRKGAAMVSGVAFPNPANGNDGLGSVELPSGTFDFQVTPSGRENAAIVDVPQVVLDDGAYVTIFAYGSLDAPLYSIQSVSAADATLVTTGNPIETETVIVDPSETEVQPEIVEGSVAFIRVGHFSSDAPAVDVYLNGEITDVANLEVGNLTDWEAVPAGDYKIDVTLAGGTPDKAIISLDEVTLEPDSWTTLSVVGSLGQDTLTLAAATEDYKTEIKDGETRLSLFHAIEGMSGIDLVRSGTAMIGSVAFPDAAKGNDGAGSVEIAAGTYTIQITAAGRTDA
ncbi:MAG TPA: DUF4397 domain-containing protein, partial [Phototrophicaceae bacterium]|nr:DUF4397 domain-containing protein [Phototrophicaceae bacterium]